MQDFGGARLIAQAPLGFDLRRRAGEASLAVASERGDLVVHAAARVGERAADDRRGLLLCGLRDRAAFLGALVLDFADERVGMGVGVGSGHGPIPRRDFTRRAKRGRLDARQHVGDDGDGRRVGEERRLELILRNVARALGGDDHQRCAAPAVGEGRGDVGRLRREGFDAGQPEAASPSVRRR